MKADKAWLAAVLLLTLAGFGLALAPNEAAQRKAAEPNPAQVARKRLAQRIDLPKGIDANTTLKDALEFFDQEFKVHFLVDSNAFAAIGVQKVEEQPVQLPPMKNVRLATVLRLLLKQIKGDVYSGSYLVRPDGIEVTTTYNVLQEVLGASFPPQEEEAAAPEKPGAVPSIFDSRKKPAGVTEIRANPDNVVHVEFDKRPLNEALKELADAEGANIVIDPHVGDKAKQPVTATLNNALLDTAVVVLTEMADLKVVRLTNVLYVTTPEKAAVMKAEQGKRRYRPDSLSGGAAPK